MQVPTGTAACAAACSGLWWRQGPWDPAQDASEDSGIPWACSVTPTDAAEADSMAPVPNENQDPPRQAVQPRGAEACRAEDAAPRPTAPRCVVRSAEGDECGSGAKPLEVRAHVAVCSPVLLRGQHPVDRCLQQPGKHGNVSDRERAAHKETPAIAQGTFQHHKTAGDPDLVGQHLRRAEIGPAAYVRNLCGVEWIATAHQLLCLIEFPW
mmetsp:Transcript_29351/g.80555  ORF Transcript_29351/g.80555 Transcript_29351/m.80555 type:complete len:210 (+) Transcript_29351:584-1213(+)